MKNQEVIDSQDAKLRELELMLYKHYDKRVQEINEFFECQVHLMLESKNLWQHIAKAIVRYAIDPEGTMDKPQNEEEIAQLEAKNMRLQAENSRLNDQVRELEKALKDRMEEAYQMYCEARDEAEILREHLAKK